MGYECIYDKGLVNLNKDWIITIANKSKEEQFLKTLPEFRGFVKAFKSERGRIERVFGVAVSRWNILQKPWKGRGLRYDRFAQIVLLILQLTNLVFKYEKSLDPSKTNLVQVEQPADFNELLKKVDG